MSILNLAQHAIDSTPELVLLPAGEEVEARIVNVLEGTSEKVGDWIMVFYDIPDQPEVAEFNDFFVLPADSQSKGDYDKARRKLQNLGIAFDIDWSDAVDLEELRGQMGYIIVGVGKDKEGQPCNSVRKYVAGH